MNQLLEDLLKVMTLERLELNLFRGESRDVGSPQVFGGQVLGQALMAATATVENPAAQRGEAERSDARRGDARRGDAQRIVHSLHAYFLRRGDFNAPIVYEVDRARDGNHFSTRRVVAIQHGAPIFNMSASFQAPEDGIDHQLPMPMVPAPEELPDVSSYYQDVLAQLPARKRRLLDQKRPFEFRPTTPPRVLEQHQADPHRSIWFRAVETLSEGEAMHRCLLAYVSDFFLLETSLMPHGLSVGSPDLIMASIDHAMWFHRSVRVDEWLLYATDSPSASGARGFSRGSIFARDGRLVASTAQEGLVRVVATP